MTSERIRRARRPEARPSGGIPAWVVVLGLVAALAAGAWLMQTGGSPLRSRRLSSL